MYVFLLGAFLSFGVGYIARNLDLVNRFYESFSNISSTTHKVCTRLLSVKPECSRSTKYSVTDPARSLFTCSRANWPLVRVFHVAVSASCAFDSKSSFPGDSHTSLSHSRIRIEIG